MEKNASSGRLSEELKMKLAACKTKEEMKRVLTEAGIESVDDDLLDGASGGMRDPDFDWYKRKKN